MKDFEWSDGRTKEGRILNQLKSFSNDYKNGFKRGFKGLLGLILFSTVYVSVVHIVLTYFGLGFVPSWVTSATLQVPLGTLLLITSKWWSRMYVVGWVSVSIMVLGVGLLLNLTIPDPIWSNLGFAVLALIFKFRKSRYPW